MKKTFYETVGSPLDRMNEMADERIKNGMFRNLEEYFKDGYTAEIVGKPVHVTESPIEYSVLTGTIPRDICEVASALDRKYCNMPLLTEVPMYREVLIAELELLRNFATEAVENMKKYDSENKENPYPHLPAPASLEDSYTDA